MSAVNSVGTGFLYDGGTVPICCSPEYLAAYGVGIDSTYGDGIVQGVLREDQAEAAFMSMFPGQYDSVEAAAGQLETLTGEIKTFALGLPDETNLFDIIKEVRDTEDETQLSENAAAFKAIADQIETLISGNQELESMLTNFFGQDSIDQEGGIGLMMAGTVLMGYDVRDNTDGGDGANGRDDTTFTADDRAYLEAGSQPRVSLGEIVQWSLEANAYMSLYSGAKEGDESLADFTQRAFTAVSEGDQASIQAISASSGYSPEQIQVLVSVMMNNHSNLMSTTGNFANSGKNGAHEYLNDMNGGNRAFNMLHIGNLGTTDDINEDGTVNDSNGDADAANDGNENLNNVVQDVSSGEANSIFYAGDNGQGANGGFNDLTADGGYISAYDANPMSAATAVDPTASSLLADPIAKSELLNGLSEMGAGFIGGNTPPVDVEINGETVTASIEQSEDFENEGYDVVIITLTDADGNVVGSMTATEAMGTDGQPDLVEYADNNGDGIVDAVDEGGLSTEVFEENTTGQMGANGTSVDLTYNDADSEAGSGMIADYGAGAATGLAMNEAYDAASGEWLAIDGFGAEGVATIAAPVGGIAATPGTGMAEEAPEAVDPTAEEAAVVDPVEEEEAAPVAATPEPVAATPVAPDATVTATEADAGPITGADGTTASDPFAGMTAGTTDVFDGTVVNFIGAGTIGTGTAGTPGMMGTGVAATPATAADLPVGSPAATAATEPGAVVTIMPDGGFMVGGQYFDAQGQPATAAPATAAPATAMTATEADPVGAI